MSASPARARRRRGCRRKQPDNGRAPKLLQKLGRVNHDFAFFSRARGEWAPRPRQQSEPPMPAPTDTRAAN